MLNPPSFITSFLLVATLYSQSVIAGMSVEELSIHTASSTKVSALHNASHTASRESILVRISGSKDIMRATRGMTIHALNSGQYLTASVHGDTLAFFSDNNMVYHTAPHKRQCYELCTLDISYPLLLDGNSSLSLEISLYDEVGAKLDSLSIPSTVLSRHHIDASVTDVFNIAISENHVDISNNALSLVSPSEFVITTRSGGITSKVKKWIEPGYYIRINLDEDLDYLGINYDLSASETHTYSSEVTFHDSEDPFFIGHDKRWSLILTKGLFHNDMGVHHHAQARH